MTDDGRRWVPEGGLQRLRDKIHKESKVADQKGLPYTFSKPPARKSSMGCECEECGYQFSGTKNTVMIVCPDCKKLTRVRGI